MSIQLSGMRAPPAREIVSIHLDLPRCCVVGPISIRTTQLEVGTGVSLSVTRVG
jgi:hypothetical protein